MKNLKLVVSALAICGVSSFALASSTTAPAAGHPAPAAAAAAAPAATPLTGKVASINLETKSFKLTTSTRGADGKETTQSTEIFWNETTKLAWKNEKMTAATTTDLKAGSEVIVKTETKDSKTWASEIWFVPAATPAQPAVK